MSSLGNAIAAVGNKLGLPELGISEALGGDYTYGQGTVGSNGRVGLASFAMGAPMPSATQGDITSPADPTNTTVLGASTGGVGSIGGTNTGVQRNAINSVYDQRISRLNDLAAALAPKQQAALDQYMQGFNLNSGLLADARDRGLRNLDIATQTNDQNKAQSFQDIASGIRNSIAAFRNQLGTMNASDSSAADIFAPYAFARLQGQQRGDVMNTYNQNATQIDIARQNVEGDFANQLNQMKFEKDNAVRGIVDQYAQIRQQISDELATADEARAFELANLGQQYTLKAMASIQALDQQFQDTSNALASKYQAMTANTDSLQPTVNPQAYSTYGRTYTPNINSFSNASEGIVAPSKLREQF